MVERKTDREKKKKDREAERQSQRADRRDADSQSVGHRRIESTATLQQERRAGPDRRIEALDRQTAVNSPM